MSNFTIPTVHPVSGKTVNAMWLDDHFGRHLYGIQFEGEEKVYRASEIINTSEPADDDVNGFEKDADSGAVF